MNKKINHVRLSLRLPPALHKRLRAQAQLDRRSLHGHVVWLLEHTIAAQEAVASSHGRTPPPAG